jgi:hypothetical protein
MPEPRLKITDAEHECIQNLIVFLSKYVLAIQKHTDTLK